MFNLHTHSTASDGAVPPEELPGLAMCEGLEGIALTDHDTTSGVQAFLDAGNAYAGLVCIPGVELSCQPEEGGEIHLVGLQIDYLNDALQRVLSQIRIWRQERNSGILDKLAELGMNIDKEKLGKSKDDADDVMGRPHIADALVAQGYCRNFQEAFDKYLRRGRPGYVPRKKLGVYEAINVIHQAGGIAVWAHPLSKNITQHKFHEMLLDYRKNGLDAVEVWHPDHNERKMESIIAFARELGLGVSGGTDFHGGSAHSGVMLSTVDGKRFPLPDKLPQRKF